ncbi:MAG: cobyric acid synthase [Solirubrobacteraceae bacterium]|jgi:adenosylcobyric acid synthase|nr:cobyric acid synthase [Solirubrobacteraceae bacterium]
MCFGTGSHAGKSVLAAALCRIYARRGYRVAPFKAQNMALNSYVTPEGGELGRAQAYQARAAGLEPHVDMNPVLLKPSSQTGSQVIVLGRPVRHMAVREYHAYQPEVWPTVTAAFERLRAQYDLIVMEGAGSPAEINLRGQDIVNMKMALYARSPSLLIGDIDRGGVFASLVGHVELFTPEERELVAAFVINKFRGDASLLDSGIAFLRERTGVPTLGVVPMLADWRGDEEDSLGIEDRRRRARPDAPLQIAVVRLPFISNYTDFDALADEPDVNVRYVTTPGELGGVAAIVLPGTKSTIADLAWLRESGLAAAVTAAAAAGTPVVGVCGGYQMLGRRIHDPDGVESDAGSVDGLGLLDAETAFAGDKRTVRVEGELLGIEGAQEEASAGALPPGSPAVPSPLGAAGTPLRGYEIHMGRTKLGPGAAPLLRLRGADGAAHDDGAVALAGPDAAPSGAAPRVCGSYVHGLFDQPELRTGFLNGLRDAAGLARSEAAAVSPDDDIDRLADHVEIYLDMELLDRIVGLEVW